MIEKAYDTEYNREERMYGGIYLRKYKAFTEIMKQAAERLKCSGSAVSGAYYGNYAIGHRYAIEAVDTAIPKQDPIWIEWETRRNWFLKLCGRT